MKTLWFALNNRHSNAPCKRKEQETYNDKKRNGKKKESKQIKKHFTLMLNQT